MKRRRKRGKHPINNNNLIKMEKKGRDGGRRMRRESRIMNTQSRR